MSSRGRILVVLALLLTALVVGADARYQGATPLPLEAAPHLFSAARARSAWATVLGDAGPHPVGSAPNRAVRQRLLTALTALGFAPRTTAAWQCGPFACAEVHDVVAELRGGDRDAILLAAHYDSVPAGPGVADDGAGVATLLEIARALRAGPPLPHDLVFLFSDGEEVGLLGAEAFAAHDPAFARVRVVLNVEARGSRGPAMMFEAPTDAGPLVAAFATAPRPVSASVFAFAYRQMPNDTDFSVFRRRGVPGLNFAFLEGVEHYHTPADDLAHLDDRSLQHLGDSVLSTARALDPRAPARGVVWFDVLGLFVARYPRALAVPLGLLAVVAFVFAVVRARAHLGLAVLGVVGRTILALVLAFAAGFAVVRFVGAPVPFVATPAPTVLCAHAVGAAAALVLLARGRAAVVHAGVLGVVVGSALLVAGLAPDLSYLFLVPALVGSLAAAVFGFGALGQGALTIAQWVPWTFVIPTLVPALGLDATPLVAFLSAWLVAPIAALCSGLAVRRGGVFLGIVAVVAATVARRAPAFDREHPQRVNVRLEAPMVGCPTWVVDAGWGGFPWGPRPPEMQGGPACGVDAGPRPTWQEVGVVEGRRRIRVVPSPGGDTVLVARVRVRAIVGSTAEPRAHATHLLGGQSANLFSGVPPTGLELEVDDGPVVLIELRRGVPQGGPVRPPTATASQEGDLTLLWAPSTTP